MVLREVECEDFSYGFESVIASHGASIKVRPISRPFTFLFLINSTRDPSQHSKLQQEIEDQSTALYSTARIWDDGIIRPTDTRMAVGLALALSAREHPVVDVKSGNRNGFGVFRM